MPCGLVLSAGGMFGAYQAGAWNVLSRRFQPDLVVGASVGALNGWAIAGGCPPAELLALWRDPATAGTMRLRFPVVPWKGCLDPVGLTRQVQRLVRAVPAPRPLFRTVVEVPRLRLVRVPHERITPAPSDGFLRRPVRLPARANRWQALCGWRRPGHPAGLGGRRNGSHPHDRRELPSLDAFLPLRAAGLVRFFGQKPAAAGLDVVGDPTPRPLGSIRDALTWSAENVRQWIQQGEEDAAKVSCAFSGPGSSVL